MSKKGEEAVKNPLSGQKVNLAGKEYDRGTLSPEINAMIDDIMAMRQEHGKAMEVAKKLEGAIAYVDQKLAKKLTKGQQGGSNESKG